MEEGHTLHSVALGACIFISNLLLMYYYYYGSCLIHVMSSVFK